MGERIYLNNDWKFTETYEEALLDASFDDSGLESVRLPHTCKELPFHYFDEHIYQMVSGYRRIIQAKPEWEGQVVLLTIDGAAHESEVYLNGEKIGEHHCGYTAFTMDISKQLKYGEDNVLAVRVDSNESLNIPPFGFVIDYMTYGGIYRDVYLDIKNPSYLEDVFVYAEFGPAKEREKFPRRAIKAELVTEAVFSGPVLAEGCEGKVRISYRKEGEGDYVLAGESEIKNLKQKMSYTVENVVLWDIDRPVLYEVKIELSCNGEVTDVRSITMGFRKAEFKTDGFYLNGCKVKLRGLNRHQCYPYTGYAMPESVQRNDADILKKELGVNAVRTSHYPQSHYFLDECDKLGLLVFTEIPGWQHIGDDAWKDQAVQNVKDMITQYRNHSSIILWGVRINESQDDDEFYLRTNAAAHELDPSRPTGGVRYLKKSSLLEDVYTYNDFSHNGNTKGCEPKANITPDKAKPYLISEYNGHMYPTKSYDDEEHRREHAIRHAKVLNEVAAQQDIAGSFGWCMFDYNTHKDFGSGDRICYHGVLDMFRNPKQAALVYAAQQEETPVLDLSSSMDIGEHPAANQGNMYIYTNADSVLMYKNDRFIKEYTAADSPYKYLKHPPILIDDFIGDAILENEDFTASQARDIKDVLNMFARYGATDLPVSGQLIAAKLKGIYRMTEGDAMNLYNRYIGNWGGTSTVFRFEAVKDGQVVKTILRKPMTDLHMEVKADHTLLKEGNSYDVAAVRICMVDENENLLHFYNEPVIMETEGPVEIIGPAIVSLKGGMGGTYLRTTGKPGKAVLKLRTEQTEEVCLEFMVEV